MIDDKDINGEYWFTCPKCNQMYAVNTDQAYGTISIVCPTEDCDFHETGKVYPLILTKVATKPEDAPSKLIK